ncbi:MAG: YkgJ family cysteine cluster protein [Eubacteriales bacterium]|nr:YkgJ family cysteine cluster protein [Eubacteriales bacterium]
MMREVSLEEISDGRLYGLNDMVKADCRDCKGCSACCEGMGHSIVLDPLDMYRLCSGLHRTPEELLNTCLELNVCDGSILPNLKMAGEKEQCVFLNKEGRCTIHALRPGMCRLFPLGRYYENGSFRYFLQVHECRKENRSKIKVYKWIDTPDLKKNQKFVSDWHYFLKDVQEIVANTRDTQLIRNLNVYVVNRFYVKPYEEREDFYEQFYRRLQEARQLIKLA